MANDPDQSPGPLPVPRAARTWAGPSRGCWKSARRDTSPTTKQPIAIARAHFANLNDGGASPNAYLGLISTWHDETGRSSDPAFPSRRQSRLHLLDYPELAQLPSVEQLSRRGPCQGFTGQEPADPSASRYRSGTGTYLTLQYCGSACLCLFVDPGQPGKVCVQMFFPLAGISPSDGRCCVL